MRIPYISTAKPAVLCSQENTATYLPNYWRLALAILFLTFYLRPAALLGTAAIALSMYHHYNRIKQQQQRERERRGNGTDSAAAAPEMPQDPNEQLLSAAYTIGAWMLVVYTRCMPILMLAMVLATASVLLHAVARRAPSEYRHRGRHLLGYTLSEVLGRSAPPTADADPRLLFKQLLQV